MTNAEAAAKFQAGQITVDELAQVMQANAKADVEAENIARHGTADSVTVYSDILTGR